ncbi:MAG TPA: acyl-CoA dehydrogenase family protein [Steroidobacteraceae bacterium]|nr:acyl-CoA dehydrogenase family protein [Steroidobacteraceae bacterium]
MNFQLTEQQRSIRDEYRRFVSDVIEPGATQRDQVGEFHYDLIPKLADSGIFALPFAEEVGGLGGSAVEYALALEEVSRSDISVAMTVANQVGLSALPIVAFGSPAQKERWLVPLFRGETLGCFALTEPGGGSDNRGMKTTATRVSSGWSISGSKLFITNAGTDMTGFLIVAARTGTAADGRPQIGAFLVERATHGLTLGPPLNKTGWRSSDTRAVYLDNCLVPEDSALGDPQRGLRTMLGTLKFGRIQIATMCVGLAQRALEEAVSYATQRRAFGKPISEYQGTSFKMSDMALGVHAARLLTLEAAWRRDQALEYGPQAGEAKLFASEVAMKSAHDCVQIHGGSGFMDDTVPSRLFRDAKGLEIGEGTSEIQRMLIAREALGGKFA